MKDENGKWFVVAVNNSADEQTVNLPVLSDGLIRAASVLNGPITTGYILLGPTFLGFLFDLRQAAILNKPKP